MSNNHLKSEPFEVRRIEPKVAKPFIAAHHYARKAAGGWSGFFGAFVDGELYAVAQYGVGANMHSAASFARLSGLPVTKRNMVELTRVCRLGERGSALIPMSAFLSRCHRLLQTEGLTGFYSGPRKRFVVSYSDPAEGHEGALYRAANFKPFGSTRAERQFRDRETGLVMHARNVHGRAQAWNDRWPDLVEMCGMDTPTMAWSMGLKPYRAEPKDRWLLDLGEPPRGQPWD